MANTLDVVTFYEFIQTPGVYTDNNIKAIALALPSFSASGMSVGCCIRTSAGVRPHIS